MEGLRMRKVTLLAVFMLATLAWTVAQQPAPSTGQQPQQPGATQSQPSAPGSAAQDPSQGAQPQAGNSPITEGCLGGTDPNFTLTDKAGTTYKLSFPSSSNVSSLSSHIGESVQVMGDVKSSSITVSKIGRGTGNCPATGQAPKK